MADILKGKRRRCNNLCNLIYSYKTITDSRYKAYTNILKGRNLIQLQFDDTIYCSVDLED